MGVPSKSLYAAANFTDRDMSHNGSVDITNNISTQPYGFALHFSTATSILETADENEYFQHATTSKFKVNCL